MREQHCENTPRTWHDAASGNHLHPPSSSSATQVFTCSDREHVALRRITFQISQGPSEVSLEKREKAKRDYYFGILDMGATLDDNRWTEKSSTPVFKLPINATSVSGSCLNW